MSGVFQVSASRTDIEDVEEIAAQNQRTEEQPEEGLFDMVTAGTLSVGKFHCRYTEVLLLRI